MGLGASMDSVPVLILPGIGNSGPDHWQSRWEAKHPTWRRVQQRDWDHPERSEWVGTLDLALDQSGPRSVIVAHSLGCLVVAHWASARLRSLGGALLVAPPDPDGSAFPQEAVGFSPLPMTALPFPTILVTSTDDPYSSLEFARDCAMAWNSRFISVGALGHINSASNLGDWPEGEGLFRELVTGPQRVS